MKRIALFLALAAPALLASASVPLVTERETVGEALARTQAETRNAEARVAALERRERGAGDDAAKLGVERQRAAAQIELAEARLAGADASLAEARGAVARNEQRLAQRRAPLAGLLAGLATIGRRPPILALADGASLRDILRVRALVDTTMPVIAQRSASLRAELGSGRKLAERAAEARQAIDLRRTELAAEQRRFVELEARALARAAQLRQGALGAEDQFVTGGEAILDLRGEAEAAAAARSAARAVALLPLAPARPFAGEGDATRPPLVYHLPTAAPVIEGLSEVSSAGVRSRGIRFATPRGAVITAPAAGMVLFAGAFRDHDAIIIIDHGAGWTSLLSGVAPAVRRGMRIAADAPLGRALGDVSLELRERGQPRSPALIAGSSRLLSNRPNYR
ncbi:MAG: peptidoglycan DD-metalloendopeptidase family protein [Sphingomonas bacterium]|nr:peptidoglycan DD-metalloendopeptidase family protein [Sphingomonas bacterium]